MYNGIKRKNILIFIAVVLGLFGIIAISTILEAHYIESKYNKAIALIDEAAYEEAKEVFLRLSKTPGLCVKGFMAMLPDSDNEELLRELTRKMRTLPLQYGTTLKA